MISPIETTRPGTGYQDGDTNMQTLTPATIDSHSLWPKLAAILAFIGRIRIPGQAATGSFEQHHPDRDRPECGGYNEAFIIQHWTGYNPNH
jgi:hypothetical protein